MILGFKRQFEMPIKKAQRFTPSGRINQIDGSLAC